MKILNADLYRKVYPNCPTEFPDELLSERHAAVIHGQSLKRLNERGGMTPVEICLNLDREYNWQGKMKPDEEAIKVIINAINKHELSRVQRTEEGE